MSSPAPDASSPPILITRPIGAKVDPWPAWKNRLWNLSWCCSASAPVLIAGWLKPDAHGVGTHRQLGLPPCTFLYLTGFPCPFCGMTTSWSLAAHGRIGESIWNQPMGFVLFAITAAFVPFLLLKAVRGRDAFKPEHVFQRVTLWMWIAFIATLALSWVWKSLLIRGWIA